MIRRPDNLHEPVIELLVIGDEILSGRTADRNAAVMRDMLSDAGYRVAYIGIVGDNLTGIAAALRQSVTRADIVIVTGGLGPTSDDITMEAMREAFRSLSEEVGVLAKAFGFGEAGPVYELHCPMAFDGQGAVWYQADDAVRNPYYGASMLKCADRVEKLVQDEPAAAPPSQ